MDKKNNKTPIDYRKSHLHPEKGKSYHAKFSENPYRKMVWELEKDILNKILNDYYGKKDICHLDYACGTGRILHYLSGRAKKSVGVDLSPSMLAVAQRNNKSSEIIEADITRNDVLDEKKFNLITAFRFFPNAQSELRHQTMRTLKRHLAPDGYLVFNNHLNNDCVVMRISKLLGRQGLNGMSVKEVEMLLRDNDLKIVEIYHLCVLPSTEKYQILPINILKYIEKKLSFFKYLKNYGKNLIYVCEANGN